MPRMFKVSVRAAVGSLIHFFFFSSVTLFFFNFILFFKLYIIVLVLPNIKMNPPQVYMCFVSSLSCMVIGVKPPWAGKGIST